MDENVIFNPNQQQVTTPDAAAQTADTNVAATGADTSPDDASPVQSSPLANLLSGGLRKKALLAGGVVFFIILLVIIFIPKKKTTQHVTLVWWNLWEDQNVVAPIINDFERQNPDITVEYVQQDPDSYLDRLQTRLQNGSGPDIFTYHNSWLPMLSGDVLPLSSDVITPDEFQQTFYPVMQHDLVQNGAIYGLPLGVDDLALFANTDIFKAAGATVPTNWDDFSKVAAKLTVKDDSGKIKTAGAAMGTYDNITHAPDLISLLLVQQGVNMQKFPTDAQNESDALDFYTSFASGEQPVWSSTLDESQLAFAKGNLAMYIGFSWDIFAIQKLNPNLNFAIYPVPALFDTRKTIASYWVQGVSTKSTHQQAAYLFMKYLAQKDTAQKLYTEEAKERGFGEPYARRDLAATLKNNALVYPFVSQLENAASSFFASDTRDGDSGLNSSANAYLQTAVNALLNNGTSSQTVVQTLDQGISQVFQKYGMQ